MEHIAGSYRKVRLVNSSSVLIYLRSGFAVSKSCSGNIYCPRFSVLSCIGRSLSIGHYPAKAFVVNS